MFSRSIFKKKKKKKSSILLKLNRALNFDGAGKIGSKTRFI